MKVLQVHGDHDYASLKLSRPGDNMKLSRAANAERAYDGVPPVPLAYLQTDDPDGFLPVDCPQLSSDAIMAISDRARDVFGPKLERCGFFIDAIIDGPVHYSLFLCSVELDLIDIDQSDFTRYHTGHVLTTTRIALRNTELVHDHIIFRIKFFRSRLYCLEPFIDVVTNNNLTGFAYRDLWSDADGGVDFSKMEMQYEAYPGASEDNTLRRRAELRAQLLQQGVELPHGLGVPPSRRKTPRTSNIR